MKSHLTRSTQKPDAFTGHGFSKILEKIVRAENSLIRKGRVIAQFSISALLTMGTLIMSLQLRFRQDEYSGLNDASGEDTK